MKYFSTSANFYKCADRNRRVAFGEINSMQLLLHIENVVVLHIYLSILINHQSVINVDGGGGEDK